MIPIPMPSGLFGPDRFLLLTPRWAYLGTPVQVFLLLAVFLLPLALVLWLYRYELRLVTGHQARWLLLLRVVALVVLVALVSLRPVFAHVSNEELAGRVIVAVDVSDSMEVRDPQRDPADKLRLAKALKLGGDLATTAQLDDWIEHHLAKRPIQWVKPDEFQGEPGRRLREEQDRREAHARILERVDALTRTQIARQLLSGEGVRLRDRIAARHNIELLAFSGDVQDIKSGKVVDLFRKEDSPKPAPKAKDKEKPKELVAAEETSLPPRSAATDVASPLNRAIERSGDNRGKVLGVIVLTDGQHNGGESPVKKALGLRDQKVPLYPIAMGAKKPPVDIAVLATMAPPVAFKDVDVPVKVRFRVVGLAAQELSVKIHRPGEEDKPLDERTIKHDGKDQEYLESFQVRLEKVGRQPIIATVRPLDQTAKEARAENNQASAVINVGDDKSKVLLVDGEARWEFHYIWQALLRDRSMKVSSVVFEQPRIGRVPEEELRRMNNPWLTLPAKGDRKEEPPKDKKDTFNDDPLFDYDCIILGDVAPEQLKPEDRKRLESYVADRGGTLVILAGKQAMPMAFQEEKPGAPPLKVGDAERADPLIRMLPIEEPRVVSPGEGFPVTLTEQGKDTDFLKLEGDGTTRENLARWAAMPRHYWGVVGKAKKGATTLAYVAGDEEGLTAEQKRRREEEQALMVRHNYGFGQVFFVGLDSSWRWRYRIGDTYHHRFWSQTIRWAASDKPLVTGNKYVRFGTPQAIYVGGEPVKVIVRLSDEIREVPPTLTARARIIRREKGKDKKETVAALVPLKRREFQPRVLEGEVRNVQGGDYFIELEIPELEDRLRPEDAPDGKPGKLRAEFSITEGESGEMVQLATNWTLLKELADKNGTGKVYTPEDAAEVIDLLAARAITRTDVDEDKLWQSWWILIVVLTLLTAEWVVRKWIGLP